MDRFGEEVGRDYRVLDNVVDAHAPELCRLIFTRFDIHRCVTSVCHCWRVVDANEAPITSVYPETARPALAALLAGTFSIRSSFRSALIWSRTPFCVASSKYSK